MECEILYKHHLAAHASVSFSLLERKILNIFLFNAFPKMADQEEFKIDVTRLLSFLGIKTRNYTQIYKAIQNISCTLIEWGVLKTQDFSGELTGVTFLEKFNIKNGLITYRIPRELRKLFVEPQRYTKIRMSTVAALKSSYGIALYENCSSYIGLGNTGWITVEDFKRLMGISGKYIEYRDLKKRVIKTALDDVNKHSEFHLEIIELKEARKTAKIKFHIKNKTIPDENNIIPINSELNNNRIGNNALQQELESIGVPKGKINFFLKNYSERFIKEKIEYIAKYKKTRIKPALLIAAIENDYQAQKVTDIYIPRVDKQELEKNYNEYKKKTILSWVDTLNASEWKNFCDQLINFVEHPVVMLELTNRLPNKSYKEYDITLNDMVDYTCKMLVAMRSSVEALNPPPILSWKEFIGKQ